MSKDSKISIKLITDRNALYTKENNNKTQYYLGRVSNISNEDNKNDKSHFNIINPVKIHLTNEEYQSLVNSNRIDNDKNSKINDKSLNKDISNQLESEFTNRKSDYLNDFIGKNYNNIVVLAGAGSSISSKAKYNNYKCGLTMYDLADKINYDLLKYNNDPHKESYYNLLKIANYAKFFEANEKYIDKYKKVNKAKLKIEVNKLNGKYAKYGYSHDELFNLAIIFNNFELLLSTVLEYWNFIRYLMGHESDNKGPINPYTYKDTIDEIHDRIRYYCQLRFTRKYFSHADFIQKLQQLNIKGKRLKIYSTNYDTLFEQAAIGLKSLIIDGFNYRPNRTFNENALNIDFITRKNDNKEISLSNTNLYPNVVKIFQIHGSEDWYRDTTTGEVHKANHDIVTAKINGDYDKFKEEESKKSSSESPKDSKKKNKCKPCMIFPSNNKYEQTYNDPYFDLFLNFQKDLHEDNTLLVIVGFSLSDMHIRRMVYDAMLVNKHLSMIFVSFSGVNASEHHEKIKENSTVKNYIKVTVNNNNLDKFFTSGLLSRELFLSGTMSSFTNDLNISNIYDRN